MKLCPSCGLRYPNDATHCFVDRTALDEAPDPLVGTLLAGRYRIEALLGEGGMATVYKARHTLQDRAVAIKLFRKELARDPKLRERFRREATSTSRLAHPNIIEILDSGETDDGTPYLVMEFLQGESLEGLLSRGQIPVPRAVHIVTQIMQALARAHDFGVIHRDLKPDNLFVCRSSDGRDFVKILDFGIARSMHDPRLTGAGEVFGTPQYMAPERITSIDAGPSADLYAVGVILFELCTGRLPFEAEDVTTYLLKHLREEPPSPRALNGDIPPALEILTLRLMAKDPAKRPVDAHAVVRELQAIAEELPKPKPVPLVTEAMPTPGDGVVVYRPKPTTLAPVTLERWEKRVAIFAQMLDRAFPDGAASDLVEQLDRVRQSLGRMREARTRSMEQQQKLEAMANRVREAQERFGNAMDALGKDLSRARQEVQSAREIERQWADYVRNGLASLNAIHARVAVAKPEPSEELAALYRAGADGIDALIGARAEHGRVRDYLASKEREGSDLDFQIEQLRAQLARISQVSEEEQAHVQKDLEKLGADLVEAEQALIREASDFANALRGRSELSDLFVELEALAA